MARREFGAGPRRQRGACRARKDCGGAHCHLRGRGTDPQVYATAVQEKTVNRSRPGGWSHHPPVRH